MTGRSDPGLRAGAGIQAPPPPLDPAVLLRQTDALAGDLRERTGPFDERVRTLLPARWAAVDTVSIVGDGDSYHAARAVRMAFTTLAGVDCRPVNALRFVEYDHPGSRPVDHPGLGGGGRPPRSELTLAVSASGRTPLVVRSAERARE
ncbi:hypothetical protein JBE27_21120, partial [Streptomyces albiflaviniger]|nr:hypothetical protein [Streptomyces albiflaviniger]